MYVEVGIPHLSAVVGGICIVTPTISRAPIGVVGILPRVLLAIVSVEALVLDEVGYVYGIGSRCNGKVLTYVPRYELPLSTFVCRQ